jgi:hypothetical protein
MIVSLYVLRKNVFREMHAEVMQACKKEKFNGAEIKSA